MTYSEPCPCCVIYCCCVVCVGVWRQTVRAAAGAQRAAGRWSSKPRRLKGPGIASSRTLISTAGTAQQRFVAATGSAMATMMTSFVRPTTAARCLLLLLLLLPLLAASVGVRYSTVDWYRLHNACTCVSRLSSPCDVLCLCRSCTVVVCRIDTACQRRYPADDDRTALAIRAEPP